MGGGIRIINTTVRKTDTKPKPFRQISTCQSRGAINPNERLTKQPINVIEVLVGQVWGRGNEHMVIVSLNPNFVLLSPLDAINGGEPAETWVISMQKLKEKFTLIGG